MPEGDRTIRFEADMRFVGQRWELNVVLPVDSATDDGGTEAEAIFREEYLRRFGAAATTTSGVVEWVSIRAVGIGRMGAAMIAPAQPLAGGGSTKPAGSRPVHLERAKPPETLATYDFDALRFGDRLDGPALIDGSDTTVWLPGGMTARVDAERTLIIEVSA